MRRGQVRLDGEAVFDHRPDRLLAGGLAYIPQNHSIFPKLTVAENLRMGGFLLRDAKLLAERIAEVRGDVPDPGVARREAYAASLSRRGEQRMLEIARTLLMDPPQRDIMPGRAVVSAMASAHGQSRCSIRSAGWRSRQGDA